MKVNQLRVLWNYTEDQDTICRIVDEDETVLATAVAKLSVNDNFSRNIGRKISLARAMRVANEYAEFKNKGVKSKMPTPFPKSLRTELWDAYRDMTLIVHEEEILKPARW
jgi:hypothetical protein